MEQLGFVWHRHYKFDLMYSIYIFMVCQKCMEQDYNDMPSFIKGSSLIQEFDVLDNVELN